MKKRSLLIPSIAGLAMLLAACGVTPRTSASASGFSSGGQGESSQTSGQTDPGPNPSSDTSAESHSDSASDSASSASASDSEATSASASDSAISSSASDSSEEDIPGLYKGKLRLWYHRDDMNYQNLRIYLWNQAVDGEEYEFTGEDEEYGVYFDIDLGTSEQFKDAPSTDIRLIVKKAGTWAGQSLDTFCNFEDFETDEQGVKNIYLCAGEGTSIDAFSRRIDALGDHFDVAYMNSDWKTITVTGTGTKGSRSEAEVGLISSYRLYGFTKEFYALSEAQQKKRREEFKIEEKTLTNPAKAINITLAQNCDPTTQYIVYGAFKMDETREKSKAVSVRTLYDTEAFKTNYTYDGNDLGCNVTHEGDDTFTTFKVWAPTASSAKVRCYLYGTTSSLGGADNAANYKMEYQGKGVWAATLKNTPFQWYNFVVTNANGTVEATDPYAKATGLNGLRGAIVDWNDHNAVDPEGWNAGQGVDGQLPAIRSANNLTVYEAHIRDLTADKTWTSNKENLRGTYNAFAEEGTTYTKDGVTVTTGFDHIKELGVNAIQLLPVFDQDNDERQLTVYDSLDNGGVLNEKSYNWGYNPQNYNVVEGSYSSDPANALTRVKEYKSLIKKAADNGIRIIMDVVYNHMASVANNSFTKIVPQYFFRTNAEGIYTDGSGCGNEVATERPMATKFIAESVAWWAKEYRIKGFRFDLMGCIDIDTMKAVRAAVNEIDPTIVLYGEGWTGGGSALDGAKQSNTDNIYTKLNLDANFPIGGFNDCGRDGAKGNTVWADVIPAGGWINEPSGVENVYNTLTQILGENRWKKDGHGLSSINPNQTVNYLACHDNYTLYDQINYLFYNHDKTFGDGGHEYVMQAATALSALSVFGQGLGFINGGDEIFRQKLIASDNPLFEELKESYKHASNEQGDHWIEGDGIEINQNLWLVRNSYKYGDSVNSYKWDRKADPTVNKYYQKWVQFVQLRKAEMGNTLGQTEAQITAGGTTCWNYKDLFNVNEQGEIISSKTDLLAGAFKGADGKYIYIFINKGNDATNHSIGIGNGTFQTLLNTTDNSAHGATFSISDNTITLGKFECLIVRQTA